MAKKKVKTSKKKKHVESEQKLSQDAIEAIEHFFWCFPPKYFARNLRNMVVDWLERSSGGETSYQEELLSQLSIFFPLLDKIEDEGRFESFDYERNQGHEVMRPNRRQYFDDNTY